MWILSFAAGVSYFFHVPGGNFYTLLGFAIFPFIWSLQEAMMTAELGSAFPDASAGVAWVETAFGARAGWMAGYLGWISGATDNAIYPVLFLDYLLEVADVGGGRENLHPILRFFLLAGTSLVLVYINWLGLTVVGNMSIIICAIAMSPFVVLVLVGAWQVDPQRWLELPTDNTTAIQDLVDDDGGGGSILPAVTVGGVFLRPFLNNLFWNLNSFDSGASFASDIDGEPGHVLPRAMLWTVALVICGYMLPLLVALGASDASQYDWVDGYLAKAASDIVGPWLGAWTVFAAAISNIALFQAELSADAFQLMGMAERGHMPKIFSMRSRHGTPTYGILLGAVVIVIMSVSNLDELIEMLNFNYAIALLLEYFAFIKLRISRPDLPRPFRIPLNTTGCIICLIPTIFFTLLIMLLADIQTYLFAMGANVIGMLIFYARRRELESPSLCKSLCTRRYNRVETTAGPTSEHDTDSEAGGTFA